MTANVAKAGDERPDHFDAATIDIYIADGYTGNDKFILRKDNIPYTYAGTVNAAGKNWKTFEKIDSVSLQLTGGELTFPDYTKDNVPVLLRCYFDGGLMDTENNRTYITTNETTTIVGCAMSLSFTAVEKEVTP